MPALTSQYNSKTFYPTPKNLIRKMLKKIKDSPVDILEPSAGKGDIIEAILDDQRHSQRLNISAIEIDDNLQCTLKGKNIKVIDSDFITYSGPDQFDLIIGNPPFDNGDRHLLKAIDILYSGEIVFLLNAETLRNPYSNIRKELLKRLSDLNAEIEYIQDAFKSSERPTGVEIALIYIKIERKVEGDLFSGMDEKAEDPEVKTEENYEVSTNKKIEEIVAEYNQIIKIGTETIINYYKNYKKIGKYIILKLENDREEDLASKMQNQLNEMLACIRKDFWSKTLEMPKIKERMTEKTRAEFYDKIGKQCDMDFTEKNIRQFILNLISGYEQTLSEAVIEIFDKFTVKHSYSNGIYEENIHYFNGWKTNNAFKVGEKVIIPMYGGYSSGPFTDNYQNEWGMSYGVKNQLEDIDKVMNYFDGMDRYVSIVEALESAFEKGISRKIKSTYFTVSVYKKGTIHLEFNDLNILRRFNVVGCKGKNWLPHDYNEKSYNDCDSKEKEVVNEFEGIESYNRNLNVPLFANYNPIQIGT